VAQPLATPWQHASGATFESDHLPAPWYVPSATKAFELVGLVIYMFDSDSTRVA
jgi:hypothetical protein